MEIEMLDRLGEYFVYQKIRERKGWTFEEFVGKWERDALDLG